MIKEPGATGSIDAPPSESEEDEDEVESFASFPSPDGEASSSWAFWASADCRVCVSHEVLGHLGGACAVGCGSTM